MFGKIRFESLILLMLFPLLTHAKIEARQCLSEISNKIPDFSREAAQDARRPTRIHGFSKASLDGISRGFSSQIEAVLEATNRYNPLSIHEDREYIGAVLERNGFYFYTVGTGETGMNSVQIRIRIPKSYKVVAFWHTHGAPAYRRTFFSDVDTQLVKLYKKPFYLADYTGRLKVFFPGDRVLTINAALKLGLPKKKGFSSGHFVRAENGKVLKVCTRRDV